MLQETNATYIYSYITTSKETKDNHMKLQNHLWWKDAGENGNITLYAFLNDKGQ